MAALRKRVPRFPNEIPNTGNLRDDVVAYLHGLAQPMKSIGPQTIRGLMMEPPVWNTLRAALAQAIQSKSESKSKMTAAMTAILKNAELRGEVRLEKLPPRIVSLPCDLLRFEVITRQELSDTAITEIVDDIFMPLIHATQQQ